MTSKLPYSYYCKQDGSISRRTDNDIKGQSGNRHYIAPRKSLIRSDTYGNKKSFRRTESVIKGKMLNTTKSVQVQPDNLALSPETSTALENAEMIKNNAKIQLMEICALSNLHSTRSNRNTYSEDLPPDDETEELLYLRELVASKLQDANSSKPEVNGRTHLHSEVFPGNARVPIRRIDLSAPKFRMLQRRADKSPEHGGNDWLLGRASPSEVMSKNSSVNDGATMHDDRTPNHRQTSAAECEPVRANGHVGRINACRIQIGPTVHVERELARQDLENVHISPEPSYVHGRANTVIYTYVAGSSASSNSELSRTVMPGVTKTSEQSAKLATLRKEKAGRSPVIEVAPEDMVVTNASGESENGGCTVTKAKNPNFHSNNGQVESWNAKPREQICKDDGKKLALQNDKDTEISEHLESVINKEGSDVTKIVNSGTINEKARITFYDNTENHRTHNTETFNKKIDSTNKNCLQDGRNVADKIQTKNQSGSSTNDILKKTAFVQCENIVPHCQTESLDVKAYRAIDEYLTNTFNNHNGSHSISTKNIHHQSSVPSYFSDSRVEDDLDKIDLYRPHFEELDSVLLSNDKKIKHVVHIAETFTKLLLNSELSRHKLNKNEQMPLYCCKEFPNKSSVDKDCKDSPSKSARSSTMEAELNNQDLTLSNDMHQLDTNQREIIVKVTETKSSNSNKENDYRSSYSYETSVYPMSDSSDRSKLSRNKDKDQQLKFKAHLSELSMDKSNVTVFSNILPTLSSTQTEACIRHREEQIVQANGTHNDYHYNAKSCVPSMSKTPVHEINSPRYSDNISMQELRSLKDRSEITDRFIAHILQDEKQSIEKKITCALKESAITPIVVEKLLNNLYEAKLISNARQLETLDILKNILINIQSEADEYINEGDVSGCTKACNDIVDASIQKDNHMFSNVMGGQYVLQNESTRQTEVDVNSDKTGRGAKNSCDIESCNKYSSDFVESQETREIQSDTIPSSSTSGSKSNSKSKTQPCSEGESLQQISDIHHDEEDPCEISPQYSSTKIAFIKPNEDRDVEADDPNVTVAMSENKGDNEKRWCESGDVQNRKDSTSEKQPTNQDNTQMTTGRVNDAQLDIPGDTPIATNEREITIEKMHYDITLAGGEISEVKDERLQSSTNSGKPISSAEVISKKDISPLHSLKEGDIKSPSVRIIEKNINFQHGATRENISHVNSCSVESLRGSAPLSSVRITEPILKEIKSCSKAACLNITNKENVTSNVDMQDAKEYEGNQIQGNSVTVTAIENRLEENNITEHLKNTKCNKERSPVNQKNISQKSLSSSGSSILLDDNSRSNNSVSGTNIKQIGSSSETSHSEGELYMPSSCSYSLGEVRILKKRDLIADSTVDRDSSIILLATRSMLTSLNDSTASLLGDI